MTKLGMGLVAAMLATVLGTVAATAQGKCWHCYYDSYGKKICHDDCSCKGSH
ncbi:MAG: hypothetical protein SFW09_05275 [Hyphomicrobiaceae bacterium]|nr:hypothetical protein [Hyphomicrobiaceae bacterium]